MIEGVRIGFENFSYGDNIRFTKLTSRMLRLQMSQGRLQGKAKLSKKDEEEIMDALDSLEDIMEEQRNIFAKVIHEVPQSVFVASAPPIEEMDLSAPETYLLLRADAVNVLRQMVELAMQNMGDEGKD